jgi:undecaprenyl-phosphate 4-deoxy-4-formamido-L-arabinose transferase
VDKQFEYSVIVPVYNNENGLEELIIQLNSYVKDKSAEVILVDDFSSDSSWFKLKELKKTFGNLKIIRLSKNVGQHAATICGVRESSGKFILTMDDDLVVKPIEFDKLIHLQQESNSKVVYGEFSTKDSLAIKGSKKIYKNLSRLEGKNRGRGSSFRLIDGELARQISEKHKNFIFIDEIILWYSEEIQFVEVERNPNTQNKSRYTAKNLVRTTLGIIIYSTELPLKVVTVIGLLMSSINFLIGIFFLYRKLVDKIAEQGYASLIVSILFSTGLIIFSIGIISLYLRKLLRNQNNEPLYYISDKEC